MKWFWYNTVMDTMLNATGYIAAAKAIIDKAIGDVKAIIKAGVSHWSCFVL
jgi:hypothetical protein